MKGRLCVCAFIVLSHCSALPTSLRPRPGCAGSIMPPRTVRTARPRLPQASAPAAGLPSSWGVGETLPATPNLMGLTPPVASRRITSRVGCVMDSGGRVSLCLHLPITHPTPQSAFTTQSSRSLTDSI